MPNFNEAFRGEVARLARKEIRQQVSLLQKSSAQHRRDIAALKREVAALKRKVAYFEGTERRRLARAPARAAAEGVRFSPVWLKAHRKKLGISAREYALLVGVAPLTIYNWESGKSKPREKQIAAWAAIRGLGKREVQRRLEVIEGA